MTRVLIVDIPFRQRTKSTTFIVDLLTQAGAEIEEVHWLPSEGLEKVEAAIRRADVALLIQVEVLAPLCQYLGTPPIAVPMYDAVANHADEYWEFLSGAGFACFSLALHLRLQGLGLDSAHHKFFPETSAAPREFGEGLHGFFWERRPGEALDWPTVNHFFAAHLSSLHVHLAADPNYQQTSPPRRGAGLSYSLTTSRWRKNPSDYKAALARSNVYFAPRRTEGIGMSFLEAFSQGMCVVAFDEPTHNEYIADGLTGVLLPLSLDGWSGAEALSAAPELGVEAWHVATAGRSRWEAVGAQAFVDQVLRPRQCSTPVVTLEAAREVASAWLDPHFYALLRAAVQRPGGLVDAVTSAGAFVDVIALQGGEASPRGVHLQAGESCRVLLDLEQSSHEGVVVRVHAPSPEGVELLVETKRQRVRQALSRQQSLLLCEPPEPGSQQLSVSVTALGGSLSLQDVQLVTADSLTRVVSADLDLGLLSNVFEPPVRELLLDWLLETGLTPYLPAAQLAEAREQFAAWLLHQHLDGAVLPASALRAAADSSWCHASTPPPETGIPFSVAYSLLTSLRREQDADFAKRFTQDSWSSQAWYYLHGVSEHDLGPAIASDERAHLLASAPGRVSSRLSDLVAKWRGLGVDDTTVDLPSLVDDHPGLRALLHSGS